MSRGHDLSDVLIFFLNSQGLLVFRVSVLLIVPSGFSVIVFSFVVTAPVPLTRVSSVLEIVRAQPAVSNENARADISVNVISLL